MKSGDVHFQMQDLVYTFPYHYLPDLTTISMLTRYIGRPSQIGDLAPRES